MLRLQAIGNLGKDCITNTVNGRTVMNFSIAHTEKYKDAQGVQKERTTWVDCAYWSEKTGVAPYLKKGQQIYVEGTPELKVYTKNDGTSGTSLSLRVIYLQLVGGTRMDGGGNTDNSSGSSYAPKQPATSDVDMGPGTDDLPF